MKALKESLSGKDGRKAPMELHGGRQRMKKRERPRIAIYQQWNEIPEGIAAEKRYNESPKGIASQKQWNENPEGIAWLKAYIGSHQCEG